jgi:hypothetical protein
MTSPLLPSTDAFLPPSPSAPQHPSPPASLLKLWEGWKSFAQYIGGFQSRILLGLFYFLVVTPFGVAVRIFGDPLHLRRGEKPSSWTLRNDTTQANFDEAKKQF